LASGITLTATHARIIKNLILKADLVSSKESVMGLTSTGLNSKGVSRSTVNDNLNYLLTNHFIKIVHVKDKQALQPWIYYDATPQGLITLLKTVNINEISKEFNPKIFGRFFPLIAVHWNELCEIIGNGVPFFLKLAIDQIEINIFRSFGKRETENSSPIQILTESINIDFTDDFAIKLKTPSLPVYEIDFINKKPMLKKNYIIVEQRIKKLFTFLFYFNMINKPSGISPTELYFLESIEPINIGNIKNKNFKPLDKMANYKPERILSIINQNGQLYSLLQEMVKEIYEKFQTPQSLEYLYNRIK